MKDSLETRLGIFFALAIIAALIVLEYLGGFGFLRQGLHVNALFKNVQELKAGDQVKLAGVRIGTVERVVLTNDQVLVRMNLNRTDQVKTDSKATIKFTGLMGQNYVSIGFGSPAGVPVADGAFLETIEQPDLSVILAKMENVATGVENLTKSFSGERIDNLLGPFTDFLKNNQENLSASISNLRTVSDRIVKGQGTVGRLINEDALYVSALNTVSNVQDTIKTFEGTAKDIEMVAGDAHTLLTNANQMVSQVNSGKGTVGKLVMDETLYREATESMSNLREVLQKINRGQGSVGKLVNDESLLKNVKLSLQKLDKATESLEDTGPLSVMGTVVTSLF